MAKKKFGLSSTLNKNKKTTNEENKLSTKIPLKKSQKNYEEVGKRVEEIHEKEHKNLTKKAPRKSKKEKSKLVRVTIDVPADLHKILKVKMAQDGTTIRKYILQLLYKDMRIND